VEEEFENWKHSLSAVIIVWSFMDCVLVTLNVHDDDGGAKGLIKISCLISICFQYFWVPFLIFMLKLNRGYHKQIHLRW